MSFNVKIKFKMDSSVTLLLILVAAVVIAGFLLAKLAPQKTKIDKLKFQRGLAQAEASFGSGQYQLVILDCDKLMDRALVDLKIRGQTMGERLKNCKNLGLNLNQAWQVHKLRNKVAHEVAFSPSKQDAAAAFNSTKSNLKKLKLI